MPQTDQQISKSRPYSPELRDWLYTGFLVFGTTICVLFGILLLGAAASAILNSEGDEAIVPATTAAAFFFMAALGMIAVYGAGRAILGHSPEPPGRPSSSWLILLIVYPIALFVGYLATQAGTLPELLILPTQLAAAGAPVLLVVMIVRRAGPEISPRRAWGQFLVGLWAVPPAALFFEAILLIPFILLFLLGLVLNPEMIEVIETLALRLPTYGGRDILVHPVAWAAWAGLLVTALNLIPAGQLDGGHLIYGLIGEKAKRLWPFVIAALVAFGFVWQVWWLWALLIFFFGRNHARTLDEITPLDNRRKAMAILGLLVFLLTFSPIPLLTIPPG